MNIREVTKSRKLIVAGHRGFCQTYPENTLVSFDQAVLSGVGMVELDIGLSKDKVPILCHDPTLDRTTNGTGLVSDYTYAELRRFDAGIKKSTKFSGTLIPSLEEVCKWAVRGPTDLLLNIDMKSGDTALEAVDHVMKLVFGYDLQDRCVFNSGDGRVINKIYEEYGLMLEGGPNHFEEARGFAGRRLDAVCLHSNVVTPEAVTRYTSMDKLVWCWGADDEQSINLAINAGVTLLVCDDPSLCIRVAQTRGLL